MEENCPPSCDSHSDSTVNSNCVFPTEHSPSVYTVATSKFKGVICQPNGHWGAQIYTKHQRVWLGTFKTEIEAAMAYDRAGIKIRGSHSYRNLPWNGTTSAHEASFQDQFNTETVLNMIKDGSYTIRFAEFLTGSKRRLVVPDTNASIRRGGAPIPTGAVVKQLFHKELTRSDVSTLNRLVIPKKYALKYFPMISGGDEGDNVDDLELFFMDRWDMMRSWRFRYCYWRSSQSLVFTRGWSAFVKEKGLREMDQVVFLSCEWDDQSLLLIDTVYRDDEAPDIRVDAGTSRTKGFKLFGVHIF